MAAQTHLVLREEDVVKLACEFMENRDMTISQVSLERESGVINGDLSDDIVFLRQLILDGQWEDCLEFIQPLAQLSTFDYPMFQYLILKHKFVELLCIKSEIPLANTESAVEEVVKVLKELEGVAPTKEDYSQLCLLLTLNKLSEHPDYRSWNPVKARCNCFKQILPLVRELLAGERRSPAPGPGLVAANDRLLQLIIKGILYESCVDYCQQKATASKNSNSIEFTNILSQSEFNDSDLSLLSWLQSLPPDTFSCPFEQRSLNVDVERIQKPVLETSWTEHMLVTPIRSNIFPHSAMPHGKPKSTDIMTKSLSLLLSKSQDASSAPGGGGLLNMSKSLASFHLTGKKLMDTSVDQLFRAGEDVFTAPPPSSSSEMGGGAQQQGGKEAPGGAGAADRQKTRLVSQYHRQKSIQEDVLGEGEGGEAKKATGGESGAASSVGGPNQSQRPKFVAVSTLEDVQAVRCAEFHPGGRFWAVGSNSKTLRICQYPDVAELREGHTTYQPTVMFKRTKHHKGSIYCLAWSPRGDLIATGSNDKTVKLMNFNPSTATLEGAESDLTMHDGTVRDCTFVEDGSGGAPLLISAGAGDCKVYVTDCTTSTPFQAMTGHTDHILSLYTWGGAMFVSGSQDKTVRFWDLRTRGCVNVVSYQTPESGNPRGSPVASCGVDPSGRLLVSGHEDSSCILYDIRGGRSVQSFKVHSGEVRSVRFSPSAYYLLSASYDNTLVLTDLQGDLTGPLPSVVVATHQDKAITGRWHPSDFSFLSTSADKTSTLWALPPV